MVICSCPPHEYDSEEQQYHLPVCPLYATNDGFEEDHVEDLINAVRDLKRHEPTPYSPRIARIYSIIEDIS